MAAAFSFLITDDQLDKLVEERWNILPNDNKPPTPAQVQALVITEVLPVILDRIADYVMGR